MDNDAYAVYLCASPASLPISFITHTWFVVSDHGKLSRWEMLFRDNRSATSWDYLHLNERTPFEGLDMLMHVSSPPWPGRVVGMIEGGDGSLAARMAELINTSHEHYPFKDQYSFLGPNSNTYTQWVLNQFPEAGLVLPWNAPGKGYHSA